MYSLPNTPSYYDTKPISHYISSEDRQIIYSISNTFHVNKFILHLEKLFENENFTGFNMKADSYGTSEHFITCDVFNDSKEKEQVSQIDILNIAREFCDSTFYDMEEEEARGLYSFLEKSGIWSIHNRQDRFRAYKDLIENNIDSTLISTYQEWVERLEAGMSHESNNTFSINETTLNQVACSLPEFEEFFSGISFINHWLKKYQSQLHLLQIIKDFDEKACDKLFISTFSCKPSFYEKDNQVHMFHTDSIASLSQRQIAIYNIIHKKMNYQEFQILHKISETLPAEEFYRTVETIKIEKEKVALSKNLQSIPDITKATKRSRI